MPSLPASLPPMPLQTENPGRWSAFLADVSLQQQGLNGVAGLAKAGCRAWPRDGYKETNTACGLAEKRNLNSGTADSHKISSSRNNEDNRQRPSCHALRLLVAAVNIINSNNSSYHLMSPSSGPTAELSTSQTLTPPGREALSSHFSDGKFQEMV